MSEHASAAERPRRVEAPEHSAPSHETSQAPARSRRDVVFFLIAAAVIALDQATKAAIRATLDSGEAWPDAGWVLNIVNVSNSGAAFGILQGQTIFLVATSLIGVAAIVLYYLYPPLEHGLLRVALALQLGGAAGNLIDRVRFGEVTDFINFDFWPAFNVADACISIGVVTILWFFLMLEGDRLRRTPGEGE
ncbi:MAG: signal peptidase II [Dehalococcoidia bacterium]|nr:signal peptidase II [Dehalococcoidia bacterium]MDZ4278994.1 signal peptidase II [Dehalococcoidia bacterium]